MSSNLIRPRGGSAPRRH